MPVNWASVTDFLETINPSSVVFGGLVVWILSQIRTINELRRQLLDNTVVRVSLIEKLLDIDKEQRTHLQSLDQQSQALLQALSSKDSESLKAIRGELHTNFTISFIGSYYKYYKLASLIEKGRKAERQLAFTELLPFLETCVTFITYLNHNEVVKESGSKPLRFHPSTFSFATEYISSKTTFLDRSIKARLSRCMNTFQQYQGI